MWRILVALVGGVSAQAHADFLVAREAAVVDAGRRTATFKVSFNAPPDFASVDGYGRQADEFQYYIYNEPPLVTPNQAEADPDVVIRGGEIARGGKLLVRAGEEGSGEPGAGGWGPALGAVPFKLTGTDIEFTVSWDMLRETDGKFGYVLLLVEEGEASDERSGVAGP